MDSEARNLQNDFFNAMRREKKTVTVFLGNGKRLVGRIKAFDKFTLLLEGHQGEQIIFKHAIASVAPSRSFDNRMEIRPARPEGQRRSGSGPPDEAEGPSGESE